MSAIISVRVNDQEEAALAQASALFHCKMSSLMKKFTFERLEEEYDLCVIKEYEKEKADGTLALFDFNDVVKDIDA
ncbi:MAG: DUF6290 family protein [Schwartzia sp. (in: firmicutes)]